MLDDVAKLQVAGSPLTAEKRSEIVKLMNDGFSFKQIAIRVGVSKSTLYNHGDDLRAEKAVIDADKLSSS